MKLDDTRDTFVRWQGISREQLTVASSLILGLAIAALGYQSVAVLDEKVAHVSRMQFGSLTCLAVSSVAGILLVINRLMDFRLTTQLAKLRSEKRSEVYPLEKQTDRLGKWSWRLFWLQVWSFFVGVILFAAFVMGVILPKLA